MTASPETVKACAGIVAEVDANGPRGAVGAPAGAKNVVERYPDGVGTK